MSSQDKLGIVIPTLNEAGNVPPLLDRLGAAARELPIDCEMIVVDDASTDGTAEVARTYARRDPRVRVLVRQGKRGLAGAVIHGWEHSDATICGVIDADLQHPPELLPKLVEPVLNGSDIAIASRYVNGNGESTSDWNKLRAFISHFGTLVTAPLQKRNLRVKDPLSGYFMVRRSAIEGIHLQPEGFKILLEILVKGRIGNVVEVPFRFNNRHSGKSKADVRVALHYFSLLGKLSLYSLFGPGQQ